MLTSISTALSALRSCAPVRRRPIRAVARFHTGDPATAKAETDIAIVLEELRRPLFRGFRLLIGLDGYDDYPVPMQSMRTPTPAGVLRLLWRLFRMCEQLDQDRAALPQPRSRQIKTSSWPQNITSLFTP